MWQQNHAWFSCSSSSHCSSHQNLFLVAMCRQSALFWGFLEHPLTINDSLWSRSRALSFSPSDWAIHWCLWNGKHQPDICASALLRNTKQAFYLKRQLQVTWITFYLQYSIIRNNHRVVSPDVPIESTGIT